MKTVFLVYVADQWLSANSKKVIGVGKSLESAIEFAKKSGYPLEIKDIVNLTAKGQTQGLEHNIIIQEWEVI